MRDLDRALDLVFYTLCILAAGFVAGWTARVLLKAFGGGGERRLCCEPPTCGRGFEGEVNVVEYGIFEGYECSDCYRVFLVEEGAGDDLVCPACDGAGEFVGLFEIKQADKSTARDQKGGYSRGTDSVGRDGR